MRYTKTTLDRIETLFKELGYTVRYAKGNFHSGYAIVESKKIAVINKFFDTEARINTLIDIFSTIEIDPTLKLEERSQETLEMISKVNHAE